MTVIAEDYDVKIERLELGPFGTNAYILICRKTGDSVLIDAPDNAGAIMNRLAGSSPRYILMTHSHMDHVGALSELHSRLGMPVAAHAADARRLPLSPEILLDDGNAVSFGALELEVLHTPGHTLGSLCFRLGRYLMSGDTVFTGGPGRTVSPAALRQIIESITGKIFVLPDDTQIYPGHGGSAVLKTEREEYAVFASRSHPPGLCGDVLWLSS